MSSSRGIAVLDPNDAIKTFFNDPEWMFKTGMGGMLNAASLVLCAFNYMLIPLAFLLWGLVTGYVLRAARQEAARLADGAPASASKPAASADKPTGAADKPTAAQARPAGSKGTPTASSPPGSSLEKLPDWNNWSDLLVSGLTWMAIFTGQLMFVVSMFTVALLIGAGLGISGSDHYFLPWALGSLYAVTAIAISTSFLSALLMINFAEEEKLTAAFAISKVLSRLRRKPADFAIAWLMGIGLQWAAVVIPAITVLGMFFIPSVWFVAHIVSARLLAQVWRSAGSELNDVSV